MTTENGPDDSNQKMGGKEQRPHATLDLTAEDVSAPQSKAAEESAAADSADASDAPPEAPRLEGPPPPAGGGGGIFSFATYMAAGIVGAVLALLLIYFVFTGQTSGPTTDEVAALRSDIAKSDQRIAGLESQLHETAQKAGRPAAPSADTEGLKKQISELAARVAQLEARPAPAAVSQDAIQQSLGPLAARVTELETHVTSLAKAQSEIQTNSKATALALALYNLRRAANEGRPFASELKSVAEMSPVQLDLATLEAHGDKGVPSLKQLKTDFEAAATKAIDSENEPADNSFTSELWSKAKSFIRIRRKGDVPGDTTRAILARAEYQLDAGNLKKAASEVEQLQGRAAEAMQSWETELKAKIAADEALASVEARLLSAIGGNDAEKKRGG